MNRLLALALSVVVLTITNSVFAGSEELCGTWINMDYKNLYQKPVKVIFNPDGKFEKFRNADSKFPQVEGTYKITEKWTDSEGNILYKFQQKDQFEREWKHLCKINKSGKIMGFTRARDAYDTKTFLAEIPFVDQSRIAVMGWSHGGITVIEAIYKSFINLLNTEATPFKAAIAFYPYCGKFLDQLNSPVLILIGKKDDWTFASNCSYLMPSEPTDHEVVLKVYPGAYHDFDWEGMDKIYLGHRLLYDPIAAIVIPP